jgi:hypothetical protein
MAAAVQKSRVVTEALYTAGGAAIWPVVKIGLVRADT